MVFLTGQLWRVLKSWYTGTMAAENEECRAVSQTALTRSFVLSVAQTTLSKEWIDKIDKFADKNFHASVIL